MTTGPWSSTGVIEHRLPRGESARERFDAYLETLQKAVGLEEQIAAYDEATRNRDIVTRVTGSVAGSERDRLFTGFNTPLVPEVLIATTVGQEGIDLHRECRHVVHHDLPWNPATIEQRTGRVDRIGSKTERLRGKGNGDCFLDVAVSLHRRHLRRAPVPRRARSRSGLRRHAGRRVRRRRPQETCRTPRRRNASVTTLARRGPRGHRSRRSSLRIFDYISKPNCLTELRPNGRASLGPS